MVGTIVPGVLRRSLAAVRLLTLGALAIAGLSLGGLTATSSAYAQSPWWHLTSGSRPTDLHPKHGQIVVTAANVGDASARGEAVPVKVADKLPAGLKAVSIEAVAGGQGGLSLGAVQCSLESLTCTFEHGVPPYDRIEVRIGVVVEAGAASGEANEVSVSGGEAQSASVRRPITVNAAPTPFGVEDFELADEEAGGAPDTQAGSHPFQATFTLMLNQTAEAFPAALPKDLHFKLPPGLIGNATRFPRCTWAQFYAKPTPTCSQQTVLGVAMVTLNESGALGPDTVTVPVFNLEPEVGEPARFGLLPTSPTPLFIDTSLRTGSDYGITWSMDNIAETVGLLGSEVTIWGVPGDPRHDNARGEACLEEARGKTPSEPCQPLNEPQPYPFWELPTSCTGPLQSSLEADSWREPGVFAVLAGEPMSALDHCNRLPFSPSIDVVPDVQEASTPGGLTLDMHIPEAASANPAGLGEADVKDTTIALPQGLTLNPAAADGLQTCSLEQIGLESAGLSRCPEASKVATVAVTTPLLVNPLQGAAYVAAPNANPFGSPMALYLVFEDPVSGILIKLAGEVTQDPVTGQLVSSFKNTPQIPFEDFKLRFFGGSRAPLTMPDLCGSYTTTASIVPWSGTIAAEPSSMFDITSGRNGTSCQSQEEAVLKRKQEQEALANRKREEEAAATKKHEEEESPVGTGVQGAAAFDAVVALPVPDARLARTLLEASSSGMVTVKVSCPSGVSDCVGTVTLRTLGAVSAGVARAGKEKAVLTLATGSFMVTGGKVVTVKLHLSTKARALLARLHVLRARATIIAHDSAGTRHTAHTIVTLRAARRKHGKA